MRAGERPVRRLPASTPRSSAAPRVPFVALLETASRHRSYARRATTASLELYRTSDGNRSICPRCLMNSDGVTVDARAAAAREELVDLRRRRHLAQREPTAREAPTVLADDPGPNRSRWPSPGSRRTMTQSRLLLPGDPPPR